MEMRVFSECFATHSNLLNEISHLSAVEAGYESDYRNALLLPKL
jgi:hypothetical protein